MSLDPNNYKRPDEFHGFRFIHTSDLAQSLSKSQSHSFQVPEGERPSEFTDLSGVPLWGVGKLSCAGRHYASAVIKTTVALFLTNWDMQLVAPNARQHFTWRSWIYPYADTKVILRLRSQTGEGF